MKIRKNTIHVYIYLHVMIVHAIILLAIVNAEPMVTNNEFKILDNSQSCQWYYNCSLNGQCSSDQATCICDGGYATYNAPQGIYCNYPRKKQYITFILGLVFGAFGSADFYLENYGYAVGKLIYFLGPIITLICTAMYFFCKEINEQDEQFNPHRRNNPIPQNDPDENKTDIENQKLPKDCTVYNKNNATNQNTESCSICLGEYNNNEVIKKLPCDHSFHRKCIESWTNTHDTCPLCRRSVRRIVSSMFSFRNNNSNNRNNNTSYCACFLLCFSCLWTTGLIIWNIVDVVRYGRNSINDGNGIAPEHW